MSVEDGEVTLEEPSECVQGSSQRHIGLLSGWEFGTGLTGVFCQKATAIHQFV